LINSLLSSGGFLSLAWDIDETFSIQSLSIIMDEIKAFYTSIFHYNYLEIVSRVLLLLPRLITRAFSFSSTDFLGVGIASLAHFIY